MDVRWETLGMNQYIQQSNKFAKKAIQGLIDIGHDRSIPPRERIRALRTVLDCCGEDLTPPEEKEPVGFK